MNMRSGVVVTATLVLLSACASTLPDTNSSSVTEVFWRGVDLSYVNELEACGAQYSDADGRTDPYKIFEAAGANWVRLRLWHSPDWTRYGTAEDIETSIARARAAGFNVLLDFHYSDDWVHPGKQIVPKAWVAHVNDTKTLSRLVGQYTYDTLMRLAALNLLPDAVQVGNETNTDVLITQEVAEDAPVNWTRNVQLLNAGIDAVRQVSRETERSIDVMLHIAQPENVAPWLTAGIDAGLHEFDLIGVSYYAKWSSTPYSRLGAIITDWRQKFDAAVVIVETAYPWTTASADNANNLLGEDSLIDGYPASIEGQRDQLRDLYATVVDNGGLGVVYWEPAWISTPCETRWGAGSHWENATLFDFQGRLHTGAEFLRP
ncbi:MAG: glycosyl hydrolase 53 family protein [Pseudomonadota bacterium]